MGKNSKPILSVLVDEDKKEKFADLARRYKYSMGWLVNDAIDRMLAADSIDIYNESIGNIENSQKFDPVGISRENIEEMIKNSIANLEISSIGIEDIEEIIKTSIEIALEPVEADVAELKKAFSDRVVSTTDSIANTLPPRKNIPLQLAHNHPPSEACEVEKRYTAPQLATELGIKRQTIEERRKKGTLSEIGFHAEQDGRNWFYYPVKKI